MTRRIVDDCFALPGAGAMISLRTALDRLRDGVAPVVGTEHVPLDTAFGRILAEDAIGARDVPAFDNVAVDGYAFCAEGLAPGPVRLHPGRAAAGHPFEGALPPGACLRVLTGAPMPSGADTVVMQEEVRLEVDGVVLPDGFKAGANRRRRGEDISKGATVLAAGRRIGAPEVGVLAELGLAEVPVFRPLRVALCSTGDEIVPVGAPLPPGGVYDANRSMLKALLSRLPITLSDLGILPDDGAKVAATLHDAAATHDVVLASGGASGGDEDHVVRTVARDGDVHFWRIALKPGRPLAFGSLDDCLFIGLPGNPVAAAVCFVRLARPVLLRLAGAAWGEPRALPVRAAFAMTKKPGRTEMLRGRLVADEDGIAVERIRREGSGILTSLTDADGLVEIGAEVVQVAPGDPVPYYSFAELGAV